MQKPFVADRLARPTFMRGHRRTPSLLSAGLFVSVGLSLSTLSSSGWAQAAPASDAAATLPAVSVSATKDTTVAQADTVSAGALGSRKQVDTPFSTRVVTSDEAQDLMAATANDLFKYDPAVSAISENAISENSMFNVRGMPIDTLNSIKVDGQTFPLWDTDLSLEPFEQVELLKGLSGFMYGFGSPGGIVNYVLKRPTDDPYRSISIGYQSASVFSQAVDLGGRFGNDNRFGYRLNLANEYGNTAEDHGHVPPPGGLAGASTSRITPDLTFTRRRLLSEAQNRRHAIRPDVSRSGLGIPDASTVTRYALTQPQNYYQTEMASFGTGLDYRLSENWHASLKYRFAKENRTNSDSFLFVTDDAGNYSNTLYAAMTRYFYQNVDAMVQGKFNTGSIKHDVVLGVGYQTQTSEYSNSVGWNDGYFLGYGNLYNTTLLTNDEVSIGSNLYREQRTTQAAVYASDTVQLTSRLSALVGVRYTQYRRRTYDPTGAVTSQYSADPVTPTFALMFKTDPYSTVYASYVEIVGTGWRAASEHQPQLPADVRPAEEQAV